MTDIVHPTYPNLYRIRALCDIPRHGVLTGDLGGYIESMYNLDGYENNWVADDAIVREQAQISGDSLVAESANVSGESYIKNSKVFGNAIVRGRATIINYSKVYGDAVVEGFSLVTNSSVYDKALVTGLSRIRNTKVHKDLIISGIFGEEQYIHWFLTREVIYEW